MSTAKKSFSSLPMSIGFLHDLSLEVHISHFRYYDHLSFPITKEQATKIGLDTSTVHPTGGVTVAIITDGKAITCAIAECSKKEAYHRRKGATIALGRALKAIDRKRPHKTISVPPGETVKIGPELFTDNIKAVHIIQDHA